MRKDTVRLNEKKKKKKKKSAAIRKNKSVSGEKIRKLTLKEKKKEVCRKDTKQKGRCR